MAALVLVDCASGGTKMYLALQRAPGGCVSNVEVGSIPSLSKQNGSGPAALIAGFRKFLVEAIARAAESGVSVKAIVLGLTSWWRLLDFECRAKVYEEVLLRFRQAAQEVTSAPCRFEPLSEAREAILEREAVVYAATRSNLACEAVDLVISGGNSSVNFTPAEGSQVPATSVGLKLSHGQDVVRDLGMDVWQSECMVQVDQAAGLYCKELLSRQPPPPRITVIAIGSIYWGGKAAGLAGQLKEPAEWPLLEVLERITARLEATPIGIDHACGESVLRDIANLVRIRSCFERLFPSSLRQVVRVVFARDGVVQGEQFRMTWTSGYFVRHCMDGRSLDCTPLAAAPWVKPPPGMWLELADKDSEDLDRVLRFEDTEDAEMHEIPYSRRMHLLDVLSVQQHSLEPMPELLWTRVAVVPQLVATADFGMSVGVEVRIPRATPQSRCIVVGLVGDRPKGSFEAECRPCPALGFNRRMKSLFPVVDLGINFDAKAHLVSVQRGAVQNRSMTILGTRDVPWDVRSEATYHIWLERSPTGMTQLRFARNCKVPVAVKASTQEIRPWTYEFNDSTLKLPATVYVWVQMYAEGEADLRGNGWNRLSILPLPRVPNTWSWFSGKVASSVALASARVRRSAQAKLPRWLARSFARHHDGEEGVRRLAVWPPQGCAEFCSTGNATGLGIPALVVTAGESDLWVFSSHGEALFHCTFEHTKVWSVAILSVRRLAQDTSSWHSRHDLELRLLIGCDKKDQMLQEHTVATDDPISGRHCTLREKVIPADSRLWLDGGAWGQHGRGHTDAVTGIFVDHRGGLIYTVSYDKTVMQWDENGMFLCEARGFHRDKIYSGALSPEGCWLATAAFDHVAVFSTEREHLSCAALVDHDWDHAEFDRRWFAAAFLPAGLVQEEESPSELPSCILIGDMDGEIWLVSLLQEDGLRRQSGGLTLFVSALHEGVGIRLEPHKDCVRHLCWMEADHMRRTVSTGALSLPLLCSTSSDKTIHLYDSGAIVRAYLALTCGTCHTPSVNTPSGNGPLTPSAARRTFGRTSKLLPARTQVTSGNTPPVPCALEILFHEGTIRAAGVDAFGHLYTASRHLAQWEGLDEYRAGDTVLQPKLVVREAYFLEVSIYFANLFVFALQMLYFTSNRGELALDTQARSIVSPIASITAVATLGWILPDTVWPYWRTLVFMLVAFMVVFCPSLLQTYYDAETKYDVDEHDLKNRNKQWYRKFRCYVLSFAIFNLMVIPTFKEFARLLSCHQDEDGTQRLVGYHEVVCFRGTHLVLTILFACVGFLYLACGLLLETVNFNLRSLLESRLGRAAAFPPSKTAACGRDVSMRRLLYVMFRHLIHRLELPRVNVGVFTESEWAIYSRQIRFISKVLLAAFDKLKSGDWSAWQILATFVIAFVNLLINVLFPPFLDPRLKRLILVIQCSITFASLVAVSAMLGPTATISPKSIHATVYAVAVVLPILVYLFATPCVRTLQHPCRRLSRLKEDLKKGPTGVPPVSPTCSTFVGTSTRDVSCRLAWHEHSGLSSPALAGGDTGDFDGAASLKGPRLAMTHFEVPDGPLETPTAVKSKKAAVQVAPH